MEEFKTKIKKIPGTHWWQVSKKAFSLYQSIRRKSKRRPYVRSAYFDKEKIFLELFWRHLHEKQNIRDKTRRVKYFSCAIELIERSKHKPVSKDNPNRHGEVLHRFTGITPDNETFYVQIKEEKKSGEKWLMSVFPE